MIKELIVVEGVNDTKRLQSFFDVDTIETHGMGLSKETIELVRQANEKRGVILFLDPDAPGEKIRKRLNEAIPGLKNAFVMKEDARTTKKVGIEHASGEVLKEALDHLVSYEEFHDSLSKEEFVELGLMGMKDSSVKREKVSSFFHLGKCNAKTLFKRINMLGIGYEEIRKVV
ncbi:MAG: ribonuclease M5 [Erysipelotrichaceae bacterium]|jgi:ribonuclease M5|nr:ribonuclease M5 [Erysipelotrichaceae bacterium]